MVHIMPEVYDLLYSRGIENNIWWIHKRQWKPTSLSNSHFHIFIDLISYSVYDKHYEGK